MKVSRKYLKKIICEILNNQKSEFFRRGSFIWTIKDGKPQYKGLNKNTIWPQTWHISTIENFNEVKKMGKVCDENGKLLKKNK